MKKLAFVAVVSLLAGSSLALAEPVKVLAYTRNFVTNGKGFVHDNIASNVAMLKELGKANGFDVDVSDDPAVYTDATLKQYKAIIFANANNEAFATDEQREAFKRYIHNGGGFVGIHSASGSERKWPWFWALLGGTFKRHAAMQPFTVRVVDHQHPATASLPETLKWKDEFYYLGEQPKDLHVLLVGELAGLKDKGKPAGETWPLAWYHEFEGGRSFYTALGHKKEHYSDPNFKNHILGGILWVMGQDKKETK